MMTTNPPDLITSLRRAGELAYASSDHDRDQAKVMLKGWLMDNDQLFESLKEEVVTVAAAAVLREVLMEQRTFSIKPTESKEETADYQAAADKGNRSIKGLFTRARENLLSYPLKDGTLLRDATKPLLAQQTDHHKSLVKVHAVRQLWFQSLAEAMPDDQATVEQVHGEDGANALYETARAAAEVAL